MKAKKKYLRAIYKLTDKGKTKVKTSELSSELDISNPSASEAVQKLEDNNLVCRAPYKGFTLSPLGIEKGEELSEKHELLKNFFKDIGVENPDDKATKIEDSLSIETIRKMSKNTKV